MFLPDGYSIEGGSDAQSPKAITVTAPPGTVPQLIDSPSVSPPPQPAPPLQELGQLAGLIGVSSSDYQDRQGSEPTTGIHECRDSNMR